VVASRGRDGIQTGVEEVEEGEDDAAGDGRVRASHVPHELLRWRTVVVGVEVR